MLMFSKGSGGNVCFSLSYSTLPACPTQVCPTAAHRESVLPALGATMVRDPLERGKGSVFSMRGRSPPVGWDCMGAIAECCKEDRVVTLTECAFNASLFPYRRLLLFHYLASAQSLGIWEEQSTCSCSGFCGWCCQASAGKCALCMLEGRDLAA